MSAATFTNGARRALRRVESFAPEAAEAIGEELAKVRRRIGAGDFRRAAAAAVVAATMAERLEHSAEALPGWRAVRALAVELGELAALLRLEADPRNESARAGDPGVIFDDDASTAARVLDSTATGADPEVRP